MNVVIEAICPCCRSLQPIGEREHCGIHEYYCKTCSSFVPWQNVVDQIYPPRMKGDNWCGD